MASPNVVKIVPGVSRIAIAVVDPAHRQHAHRTARAVDQLDLLGSMVSMP